MLCRQISAIAGVTLAVANVCPLAAAQALPRADEPITTLHECIDACEARRTKVIEKCERWNDATGASPAIAAPRRGTSDACATARRSTRRSDHGTATTLRA